MSTTATSPKKYGEAGTFTRIVRDKSVMYGQPIIQGIGVAAYFPLSNRSTRLFKLTTSPSTVTRR